jgi:mono/diheme cytochrome c family protein
MENLVKPISAIALAIFVAACQPVPSDEEVESAPLTAEPAIAADQQTGAEQFSKVLGFAQGACGDCHAVESPGLSPNPEAPAFADIANREGLNAETLSRWLRDAHNYPEAMDFDLDAPQVEELTAYILTLRDENYEPPIY